MQTSDEAELANRLNTYTRFDKHDFKTEQERAVQRVHRWASRPVTVEEKEVATCFRQVKPKGAVGPDNTSSKTLRECANSLASVFTGLFQWSLDDGHVPRIWKTSNITTVTRKRSPREMNDCRPEALTSVPFKCAEKIVLWRLRAETAEHQDHMQFAYCKGRATEDAFQTLLHWLYQHLDRPRTYARILLIDFSSAFNTIQPHMLIEKLL